MAVEAIIDGPVGQNAHLNDPIGECNGVVVGYEELGVAAEVNPNPRTCDGCKLSEFCTASKAD